MSDDFEPNAFRQKHVADKHEKQTLAAARVVKPAILLSILIVVAIVLYQYLS